MSSSSVSLQAPSNPIINVINKSTLLSAKDFASMVEACKVQLEQHVAPQWMRNAYTIVSNQPDSVGYPIVVMDNADVAGTLGYHTETVGGKVWGRVFVRPVLNAKGSILSGSLSVSAVLSHEIIEAFCDPFVNMWATRSDGTQVAYEICDPVENDSYVISTDSGVAVSVSNFVLPAWFDYLAASNSKFDWMQRTSRPFTMSKGGYMVVLNPKTGQIKYIFGSKESQVSHAVRQEVSVAARSTRKTVKVNPRTISSTF